MKNWQSKKEGNKRREKQGMVDEDDQRNKQIQEKEKVEEEGKIRNL